MIVTSLFSLLLIWILPTSNLAIKLSLSIASISPSALNTALLSQVFGWWRLQIRVTFGSSNNYFIIDHDSFTNDSRPILISLKITPRLGLKKDEVLFFI